MIEFPLKNPCRECGALAGSPGVVVERGGQQTLWCAACVSADPEKGYNGYNVPKRLLGIEQNHVTRPGEIKPARRWRILERDGQRCMVCGAAGAPGNPINVDHILPVALLESVGATVEEARSDYNLCAICARCNAGKSARPPLPRDVVRIVLLCLRARAAHDAMHAEKQGAA